MKLTLDSALRVYVEPGGQTVRVAADLRLSPSERHCFHLNFVDGKLVWVQYPQGAFGQEITLDDFTTWMREGGLKEVSGAGAGRGVHPASADRRSDAGSESGVREGRAVLQDNDEEG